jgi:hypothetical protein
MRGIRNGHYSELMAGDGFVGGVSDVPTENGVRDRLTAMPKRGALSFSGGRDRPLDLAAAIDHGHVRRAASIHVHAAADGGDRLALGNGRSIAFRHRGSKARVTFTLTNVAKQGGPASFESPAVTVHPGERMKLKPSSWRRLNRVRLTSHRPGGKTTRRTLRNRAGSPVSFSLHRPRIAKRHARVRTRIRRVPAQAAGGIVLRLKRHGHTVVRKDRSIGQPERGPRTFRWKLKHLRPGRYKAVANMVLAGGTELPGRRSAKRTARVRIR